MTGLSDPGRVLHVCVSHKKGVPKKQVEQVRLLAGLGVEGDAHAGAGHRQISLLDVADIDGMRAKGLELEPGAFGENLVVEGLALDGLAPGSELRVGEARLRISQVGKVCHQRCAIYHRAGDCIMPRLGLFAEVLEGGVLRAGDSVVVETQVSPERAQIAVITCSDRCSRGETQDLSGPAIVDYLSRELHARLCYSAVVADDHKVISRALREACDRGVDLCLTTGGTGFTPRDVTPEATAEVIERPAPGLAEAMRAASMQITPHAMLQRGIAGIRRRTLIINLPGSRKAVLENLAVILPALPHAIRHLRGDGSHPESDRGR